MRAFGCPARAGLPPGGEWPSKACVSPINYECHSQFPVRIIWYCSKRRFMKASLGFG